MRQGRFFCGVLPIVSDRADMRETPRKIPLDALGAGAEMLKRERSAYGTSGRCSGILLAARADIVAFRSVGEGLPACCAAEYGFAFRADGKRIHAFARDEEQSLLFAGNGCGDGVAEFFRNGGEFFLPSFESKVDSLEREGTIGKRRESDERSRFTCREQEVERWCRCAEETDGVMR